MRILMLGNSFTFTDDMPQMLAGGTDQGECGPPPPGCGGRSS